MNKQFKTEKAITLIALIITVIILVILAAVSIRAAYNMGIIKHAVNGTEGYARAEKSERELLDNFSTSIEDKVSKIGATSFELTNENAYMIGYTADTVEDLEIPGVFTYDNVKYCITSLGERLFNSDTKLKKITIPDTVETIKYSALGCENLEEVYIGKNVKNIEGGNTFALFNQKSINVDSDNPYFESLDGVLYTKNKKTIIAYPIGKTETNYTIPSGVEYIGGCAFCYAPIETITIPNTVKSIGYNAFSDSNIRSISMPNSVIEVRRGAFYNCQNLTSVTLSTAIKKIEKNTFQRCNNLSSINIPQSVRVVDSFAFDTMNYLGTTINFENYKNLQIIGDGAFCGCTSSMNTEAKNYIELLNSNYAIFDMMGYGSIGYTFEEGHFEEAGIYDALNNLKKSWDELINEGKITVENNTLKSVDTSLAGKMIISKNITTIDTRAFLNCTGITCVEIPDEVRTIKEQVFGGCTALKDVLIGSGINMIYSVTFSGCTGLEKLVIPSNVRTLGSSPFYNCSALKTIFLGDGISAIDGGTLSGANNLENVMLGNGLTTIGGGAFSGLSKIKNLVVPNSVTTLQSGALYGMNGLENLVLGNGITTLDTGTCIYQCSNLKSITLGTGLRTIQGGTFSNTTKITSITIPAGVTTINSGAFDGWTASQTINVQGYSSQAQATGYQTGWNGNATVNWAQ